VTDTVQHDADGQQDAGGANGKRSALVFVGAIGEQFVDQSIEGLGARIAGALDVEAATRPAKFAVSDVRLEPLTDAVNASVCTISRDDGQGAVPVVDVFKLDSVGTLRSRYEHMNLLLKALMPIAFIAVYLRGVWVAFRDRAGKTRRERYQVFFAISVLALMTIYLVILAVAIVKTIWPHAFDAISADLAQGVALVLTALGLTGSRVVAALVDGATGYIAVIAYLGFGDRKAPLTGQLGLLVDRVQSQDVDYEHVDIVAYSFGTIIALDALFPRDGEPPSALHSVRALVTIGCPFDFVRTYWPKSFEGRAPQATPEPWLNVYAPIDILASNFRSDGQRGDAEVGIPAPAPDGVTPRLPENIPYGDAQSADDLGPLEFVTFMGLRSHSLYWGAKQEGEHTAFSPVVSRLYAGEYVLS
jgi:hypothetical protein